MISKDILYTHLHYTHILHIIDRFYYFPVIILLINCISLPLSAVHSGKRFSQGSQARQVETVVAVDGQETANVAAAGGCLPGSSASRLHLQVRCLITLNTITIDSLV